MTILGNGDVGIGTSAPTRTLDVNGSIRISPSSGNGEIVIDAASTNSAFITLRTNGGTAAADIYATNSKQLIFRTNGTTEALQIDPSQNVGIGTTAPSSKLDVLGTARFGDHTTNYTLYSATGHQTMIGDARPWRDELSDAVNLQQTGPGVSRNATESSVEYTTGSNLSDYMYVNIQLNHDKDLTSSIYPHIHFWQAQNNVPNFLLQYRWQILGGAKTTAWTNLACNTLAFTYTSGTLNNIAYSTPIAPPVGTTLSDIIQFRILRDNANTSTVFAGTNTYTATVGVTAFDIHFMLDSLGSDTQYAK